MILCIGWRCTTQHTLPVLNLNRGNRILNNITGRIPIGLVFSSYVSKCRYQEQANQRNSSTRNRQSKSTECVYTPAGCDGWEGELCFGFIASSVWFLQNRCSDPEGLYKRNQQHSSSRCATKTKIAKHKRNEEHRDEEQHHVPEFPSQTENSTVWQSRRPFAGAVEFSFTLDGSDRCLLSPSGIKHH